MIAVFLLGLVVGAGLVALGTFLRRSDSLAPTPFASAPPHRTWDDPQVNAVIPPVPRTAADFVPVYLSDAQLAARERATVESGPAVAHEPIEAARR